MLSVKWTRPSRGHCLLSVQSGCMSPCRATSPWIRRVVCAQAAGLDRGRGGAQYHRQDSRSILRHCCIFDGVPSESLKRRCSRIDALVLPVRLNDGVDGIGLVAINEI